MPARAVGAGGRARENLAARKDSGIWYAPVLLQRKKALERGTWRVPPPAKPLPPALARAASGYASEPPAKRASSASGGVACSKCGGTGIITAPGGFSGMLCDCGAYMRRFVKSA